MREYITLIAVRILGRFIFVRILPIVRIMRLPVRELLYVRGILPVRVHRLLLVRGRQPGLEQQRVPVPHRAPAILHVPERQQVLVPEQNIDHQLRPGMKNRIKRLSLIGTITEAREIPIVDRRRIQAQLAQVVDQQVEALLLQVPIVKVDVQIVVQVLPEEIVAPAGVMFPEDKQKNVLLQEVREAVTQALPVHLKEVTVQEDNLFLYY